MSEEKIEIKERIEVADKKETWHVKDGYGRTYTVKRVPSDVFIKMNNNVAKVIFEYDVIEYTGDRDIINNNIPCTINTDDPF